MKKVFASDFDGTLYFGAQDVPISPESVQMIRTYQEAGNLFGLCTGRSINGITPFIAGQITPDFYITSTGANILDKDLRTIQKTGIDRKIAARIVKEVNSERYKTVLDIEGCMCVFSEIEYFKDCKIISSVDTAPEGLIHQISTLTESPAQAEELAIHINQVYGDHVNAFRNIESIDIVSRGCSKGNGVHVLREHLRQSFGECRIYGIGDSVNDLPLIEAADVSYTFPYAPENVQKKVTKVVKDISEALADSMEA